MPVVKRTVPLTLNGRAAGELHIELTVELAPDGKAMKSTAKAGVLASFRNARNR